MARRRTVYGNEELQTLSRLTLSDGFNMIRGDALIRTKQDSTSPDQGALVVSGGVGIGLTLNVGGGLSVRCSDGQNISLGNPDSVTGLSLYSQLQTDVVPYSDSVESAGRCNPPLELCLGGQHRQSRSHPDPFHEHRPHRRCPDHRSAVAGQFRHRRASTLHVVVARRRSHTSQRDQRRHHPGQLQRDRPWGISTSRLPASMFTATSSP